MVVENGISTRPTEMTLDLPFFVEPNFSETADILWAQFEEHLLQSVDQRGGMTPFAYVFCQDAFQFLTAGGEQIFSKGHLGSLVDRLREWAQEKLGSTFVSTPQVRLYINGCWRGFSSDKVQARWHYVLSLTRIQHRRPSEIKLLSKRTVRIAKHNLFDVERALTFQLNFNQLLVHDTTSAYSVHHRETSMKPLDGFLFLDGYLW